MSRMPVQARSLKSMNRMLDAGEELVGLGGATSLKLELILERSGASTGSFYARFGSMSGFLDALHNRALERLSTAVGHAHREALGASSLDDALTAFCTVVVAAVSDHSTTFRFFVVEQAHESTFRAAGTRMQLEGREALFGIISPYLAAPKSTASKRRMDMVFRFINAMLFQQFMFTQSEISPLELSQKALIKERVAVLVAGLAPIGLMELPASSPDGGELSQSRR